MKKMAIHGVKDQESIQTFKFKKRQEMRAGQCMEIILRFNQDPNDMAVFVFDSDLEMNAFLIGISAAVGQLAGVKADRATTCWELLEPIPASARDFVSTDAAPLIL